jgi:polar amino acid transport system substrate-binding protein
LLTSNKQNFDVNSAEDIFGKTMVLLHGFDYPGLEKHIASKDIKAIKVKSYKSAFKVVNRLKEKAGFVEMDIRIKYNLKMLALAEQDYNWHNFSKVITDYNLHLAMSPSFDKALQQHVEAQLAELKELGILEEIINSY